jgi:simple sugar transport system permease protein
MTTYEIIIYILWKALPSMIPLLIVALGGLFAEKSGVTNIGLDGQMLMGAFVGLLTIKAIENTGMPTQLVFLIGIIVGGIGAAIFSMLHAYASVYVQADQIISATALNLFAAAFVVFLAGSNFSLNSRFRIDSIPLLNKIPIIGELFFTNTYLTVFLAAIIFIVTLFILNRTRFGLHIKACGENPHAADSLGINIYKVRFISVTISGFLAGIGGVAFMTFSSSGYRADVYGYGFLAIAVLIFGNWSPKRILLAAFFFGLSASLANSYSVIPFLKSADIPTELYQSIPYVATLIVLAFFSKNSRAPKAVGQIYDQGKR